MIWPTCLDAHRILRFQFDTAAAKSPWIFPAAPYFAAGKLRFQVCQTCVYVQPGILYPFKGRGSVDKRRALLYNDANLKGCAEWHFLENFAVNAAPDIWNRWSIVRSGFFSSAHWGRRRLTAASVCWRREWIIISRGRCLVRGPFYFLIQSVFGMCKRRGCIRSPSFMLPLNALRKIHGVSIS